MWSYFHESALNVILLIDLVLFWVRETHHW